MPYHFDASKSYRIKAVAEFTGLTSHTIRKWEERYQLLAPLRGENWYRLYFEDDIQLLMYIKAQIAMGRKIGELGKIGTSKLRREMREGSIHILGVPQTHFEDANTLIQAARRQDRSLTEGMIQSLVQGLGLERAIQHVFFPVLKVVGELWHRGQICITGEHMVTQAIRRHLVETLHKRNISQGPTAIIACAPKDFHEIGTMTATLILQRNGWQPIFLGTVSGIEMIRLACKRRSARLVIISMVRELTKIEFTTFARQINNKLLSLCPVIIGGQGASRFKDLMEQEGINYFEEFNQIKQLNPQVHANPILRHGKALSPTKEKVL